MLVSISNRPRDYAWGSTSLLATLEQRTPTGRPEAEVWFGDHPGDPADLADGRTLDQWLVEHSDPAAPGRLPYLLKLLAAASPLSIQVHPSKAQAEAGFAAEEAAGVPRDAPHRLYPDDNHKPELLVAVSETFRGLVGVRELSATARLLNALGAAGRRLCDRLETEGAGPTIAWLLSGEARAEVDGVIAAVATAESAEFAEELEIVRAIAESAPGDPGVLVALLMNLVTLARGEALFVPAGTLHAYLDGLGVEVMAASDNVLRGGLTPKHVDVAELVRVLDATPGPAPLLSPTAVRPGLDRFDAGVADFCLVRVTVDGRDAVPVPLTGAGIVLAVAGRVEVAARDEHAVLAPGRAVLATADEGGLEIGGHGEVFIAMPGRT